MQIQPRYGLLYLAGCMSKYKDSKVDPWQFGVFNSAAFRLREQGFAVINPAEHFGGDTTLSWETYMKYDLKQLMDCDALILLGDDWQESKGAMLEAQNAKALGIPTLDLDLNPVHVPSLEEELAAAKDALKQWKDKAIEADATVLTLTTKRPESTHWFNTHANEIHKETYAILNERAGEYSDSWRDMPFPFLLSCLRSLGITLSTNQVRLLALAALCDTKLSRIQTGAFKADSHIDFNNYNAVYASAMREYLNG